MTTAPHESVKVTHASPKSVTSPVASSEKSNIHFDSACGLVGVGPRDSDSHSPSVAPRYALSRLAARSDSHVKRSKTGEPDLSMIRRLRKANSGKAHATVANLTKAELEDFGKNPGTFEFDETEPDVRRIAEAYQIVSTWTLFVPSASAIAWYAMSDENKATLKNIATQVDAICATIKPICNAEVKKLFSPSSARTVIKHAGKLKAELGAPIAHDRWFALLAALPEIARTAEPAITVEQVTFLLHQTEEVLAYAARVTRTDEMGVHKQVNTGLGKAAKLLAKFIKSFPDGGGPRLLERSKDLEALVHQATVRATELSNFDFQSCDSAGIDLTAQLGRIRAKFLPSEAAPGPSGATSSAAAAMPRGEEKKTKRDDDSE